MQVAVALEEGDPGGPGDEEEEEPVLDSWQFRVRVDDDDCVVQAISGCQGGPAAGEWHPTHRCAGIRRIGFMSALGRSSAGGWWLIAGPCWPISVAMLLLYLAAGAAGVGACAGEAPVWASLVLAGLWLVATSCYLLTACRDPGLAQRAAQPAEPNWRWVPQAESYAGPATSWAAEGNVLCDGYDHFCVWTGTLIGVNNYSCFCCWALTSIGFLAFLFVYGFALCV